MFLKVPRSETNYVDERIKKWPSTPNLNIDSENNWRYLMMEKTLPNTEMKKTCLTEQMKKYEEYPGQCAVVENNEVIVRRRPRKTQKTRPKSEVREKTEEGWAGRERRRPLSYIEGSKEKDFYIQTCRKPVNT